MIKEDDIQERLIQYAARIIAVCDTLPTTTAGEQLAGQLLRSGTTPALNYVEARIPRAPSESVHKLKIALTELKESEFWLRIIIASDILSLNMLAPLIGECHQLQRILIARIKTAGKPATRQPSTLDS